LCGSGGRRDPAGDKCTDVQDPGCDPTSELVQDLEAGMWEECDDADSSNNNSCTTGCLWNRCGDGFLYTTPDEPLHPRYDGEDGSANSDFPDASDRLDLFGVEVCDDGNFPFDSDAFDNENANNLDLSDPANTDACVFQRSTDLGQCQPAECGDGVRRTDVMSGGMGYEECEGDVIMGTAVNTPFCTAGSCFNACAAVPASAAPHDPSVSLTGMTAGGQFMGSCYGASNTAWNIEDVGDHCAKWGSSHVVTVTSQAENDFVHQLADQVTNGGVYLGLTDRLAEGTLSWINGEPLGYTNWATGEPDSKTNTDAATAVNGDIDCVLLGTSDGKWNDNYCNYQSTDSNPPASNDRSRQGYVCEYEFPPVL
jgi:hypothetical protein